MTSDDEKTVQDPRVKAKKKAHAYRASPDSVKTLKNSPLYFPGSSFEFRRGDRLASDADYVLTERIGRGGMGEVWSAERRFNVKNEQEELRIRQPVAMKVVTCDAENTEAKALFQEIQKLADLQHDNIAQLIDAGVADRGKYKGRPFIALQKVDGPNLDETARLHGLYEKNVVRAFTAPTLPVRTPVRIPEKLLALIMYLQTRALSHCHELGLINRDISPQNTMIDRRHGFVKVIDFGIAEHKFILRNAPDLSGKPLFMAPELLIDPDTPATELTDIFSLGMTIYTVMTGLNPFSPLRKVETLQDMLLHILQYRPMDNGNMVTPLNSLLDEAGGNGADAEFASIVSRAVAFDPEQRFASMADLGSQLEVYLYSAGIGPTIETLATYIGIIDRWRASTETDARGTIKNFQLTESEQKAFPFFDDPKKSILKPIQLSQTARAALNDAHNPAMARIFDSYRV